MGLGYYEGLHRRKVHYIIGFRLHFPVNAGFLFAKYPAVPYSNGGFGPSKQLALRLQYCQSMNAESTAKTAIPRQSLTSAVAEKLREEIIRGDIPEGAQLRQDAIATQYHVSRIPVREALRQLDAEGLITIVPNRGAIVPALSPTDIEELFTIRALLEPEILKHSIPHLTQADFSEAEAVLRKYENDLRVEERVAAWGRLNWQFHATLYSRSGRPHFMSIIRNVNNSGERYTRLQLYLTHGIRRANEDHHQLLDLCRQRDVAAACKLLRQHIEYAGQSLKQVLEDRRLANSEAQETKHPSAGNGSAATRI